MFYAFYSGCEFFKFFKYHQIFCTYFILTSSHSLSRKYNFKCSLIFLYFNLIAMECMFLILQLIIDAFDKHFRVH